MVNFRIVTGTMDASDNTSASFKAAARGKIVDYADAHPELRRDMETTMDPIDRNPDSMAAIQAYGDAAQERLDDVLHQMTLVSGRKLTSVADLRQAMADAEKLSLCRRDLTREFSTLLGASKEVLRRYNEEYIPEAHKMLRTDSDPGNETYLWDVVRRKDDFIKRMTELEGARVSSIQAAIGLRNKMEEWEAIRASGALEEKIVIFSRPLQLKTAR